ncbi:hypothetical protein SAMN04488055_2728 [Chitinophaga niabensis]|uniref:Uncharacterized protein n=1 Tax=Chitinophaga niabensis TaxID=536979 RepID=A0A1N6GEH5_9BACT|nr:hypothetical protein SAMN04488055_2728 [Chitinophaga niabensis]
MISFSSRVIPELTGCAAAVTLMYTDIFLRDKVKGHSYIFIGHFPVERGPDEVFPLWNKQIGVNVCCEIQDDIMLQDDTTIQKTIIEMIHTGLILLAEKKGKLDKAWLDSIKEEILQENFNFWIECRQFTSKKDRNWTAKVMANPKMKQFDVYLDIYYNSILRSRHLIYEGMGTRSIFGNLFSVGKWTAKHVFILSGKESDMEIHFNSADGSIKFVNISPNAPKSPLFDLFKVNKDKEEALKDYLGTLDPVVANVLSDHSNPIIKKNPASRRLFNLPDHESATLSPAVRGFRFRSKLADIIREREHEILFHDIRLVIVNIIIRLHPPYACILS